MKIRGLRWFICGLLFLATVISYIDRQTIAIAAPVIAKEFSLSNEQIATILSAFLFSYTFGQLLAGRFFDWLGSRHGFKDGDKLNLYETVDVKDDQGNVVFSDKKLVGEVTLQSVQEERSRASYSGNLEVKAGWIVMAK